MIRFSISTGANQRGPGITVASSLYQPKKTNSTCLLLLIGINSKHLPSCLWAKPTLLLLAIEQPAKNWVILMFQQMPDLYPLWCNWADGTWGTVSSTYFRWLSKTWETHQNPWAYRCSVVSGAPWPKACWDSLQVKGKLLHLLLTVTKKVALYEPRRRYMPPLKVSLWLLFEAP